MTESARPYIPAFQYDWALPMFVPFVRFLGIDRDLRAVVTHAELKPGQKLLDIGCGPGLLPMFAKQAQPAAEVTGLDPDPLALARAQASAEGQSLSIRWDRGFSDQLPYPDASFDCVTSTFMFHHLSEHERDLTLREVRRVLKPHGVLHLADFGKRQQGSLRDRVFPQGDRYQAPDMDFKKLVLAAGFARAHVILEQRVMLVGNVVHYRVPVSE